MCMAKRENIVEELRRAIRQAGEAGISRYQIAKATGLSQSTISRVMSSERGLSLDTAQLIAQAIGMRIILTKDT